MHRRRPFALAALSLAVLWSACTEPAADAPEELGDIEETEILWDEWGVPHIFAPDMGTDEVCVAWVIDEISRVVALPREIGGIPLDEIGATGWGLSHVVDVALHDCDFELEGARIVVQGFGAVGSHVARFLTARGARLVAVADSRGAMHNPAGLDVDTLLELKAAGGSVADYGDGTRLDSDAVIDVDSLGDNLPNGPLKLYNPWTRKWSDAVIEDGKVRLPSFLRSVVLRIDTEAPAT